MDLARADALAARSHLAAHGWIAPSAEPFRHLPPPDASVWLGDHRHPADAPAPWEGWHLEPIAAGPQPGVQARWLDAADPQQRAQLLAGLPAPGDDAAAPYAWAHRALLRGGLRLTVTGRADEGTVWLRLQRRATAAVEAPLLVLDLLPGARCVLLESHEGSAHQDGAGRIVQNLQVHVRLAAGASLQHLRVALPGAEDHVAHHVQVRLDGDAVYRQCLLGGGSRYHLQRTVLDLAGRRASSHAAGVLLAAASALDQQVQVRHADAHTRSGVDILALGSGPARVVANAHTTIAPGCDEAQARQRLAGTPTCGQPRLVLRPHLEIHHDQVQAAHGATWGALPEEALFHARQRGLDEHTAKAMILHGMAAAVLERAIDEPGVLDEGGVHARLAQALDAHLASAPGEGSHG